MSRRNFEAVVMDTVYAVIHVEYVFIAHILLVLKYGRCRINVYDILAWKNCKI